MKTLSYIFSVVVFIAFLYTSLVAAIYLAQFIFDFSGEGVGTGVAVLMLYGVTLEALAIIYKKLPYKPRTNLCSWLENLSFLRSDRVEDLVSKTGLSSEQKADFEKMARESVESLNRSVGESEERSARYEKIYVIEKSMWPHGMGSKMRDEIPEDLQKELDECIKKSQGVAREACQTEKLTEEYLRAQVSRG